MPNFKKDFDYLGDERLVGVPQPALIRNVYQRLQKLGELTTKKNIEEALKFYGHRYDKVASVLARLQRQEANKRGDADGKMALDDFKTKLTNKGCGPVKGYQNALKVMTQQGLHKDVKTIINGLSARNVFSAHKDKKVRYDKQDATQDSQNFQVQLGGSGLKLLRKDYGDTSVTAVLVSNEVLGLCDKSKPILNHMAGEMKKAHDLSFKKGKKSAFTLSD